jgi:hypothetical protein
VPNDDRAVLIGLSHYPFLGHLKGPANDLALLRDWLESPDGGNLDPANIHQVLSAEHARHNQRASGARARPNLSDITTAFEELIDSQVDDEPIGRRLYIFLAGHGIDADLEGAALLMANANPRRLRHHVAGRKYANWFRGAALFEEVLLFMDCCRDNYPALVFQEPPWDREAHPDAGAVRIFYGFAAQAGAKSREHKAKVDGETRYLGYFTRALVAALRYARPDDHGAVSGAAVAAYVYNFMRLLVDENDRQEARFSIEAGRDITLVTRDESPSLPVRLRFLLPDPSQRVRIRDHALSDLGLERAKSRPWRLDLPAGKYQIYRPEDPSQGQSFDVIGDGAVNVDVTF